VETHHRILQNLADELFSPAEMERLRQIVKTEPFDPDKVIEFDLSLGGPSISRIICKRSGRYSVDDRDIFRPLQYCSMYFLPTHRREIEWDSRDIVEMSSLHIESLIKRIGQVGFLPLGQALGNMFVKSKVDLVTWEQIKRYTRIYNSAKHDFSHEKDTHMFSVQDALLAYFICRKLGQKLYPLADLVTDLTVFESGCEDNA